MAHSGAERSAGGSLFRPHRIASVGRRCGAALLIGGWAVALYGVFRGAPAGPDAIGWLLAAMDTPVTAAGSAAWAVHVSVLVALAGVWLFGLALLIEGYFGIE